MLTRAVAIATFGLFSLLLGVPGAPVHAASSCSPYFVDGVAPALRNERLAAKTRPLCYSFFGLLHSGVTRTPLWSAEHLTRDALRQAACIDRVNKFHRETDLPADERAELSDYVRSGYDRGHLAPTADMPTEEAQDESFTLANMIPQDPTLNRRIWKNVETTVSGLTMRYGETYVVTGAAFVGSNLRSLKGRVLVPTQVFKAVYIPSIGEAAAYLADNSSSTEVRVLSIDAVTAATGIDPFPSLKASIRSNAMDLPAPSGRGRPRCRS